VGVTEYELREADERFVEHRLPYSRIDRAVTAGQTEGLIKVFAKASGEILGATVVGTNAGEMICEYALAMKNGLKLKDIANTIHPYPTYLMGVRQTADQWYMGQLRSPLLGLLRSVLGYRGGGGNGR
jgi:pyruvate/2-oxoglutarate dehydrogenase complex dihydrolipoamide dehydrogenase (E3) component